MYDTPNAILYLTIWKAPKILSCFTESLNDNSKMNLAQNKTSSISLLSITKEVRVAFMFLDILNFFLVTCPPKLLYPVLVMVVFSLLIVNEQTLILFVFSLFITLLSKL